MQGKISLVIFIYNKNELNLVSSTWEYFSLSVGFR